MPAAAAPIPRQDGRDRLGGRAEAKDHLTSPRDLVDETRESREHEDQQVSLLARGGVALCSLIDHP